MDAAAGMVTQWGKRATKSLGMTQSPLVEECEEVITTIETICIYSSITTHLWSCTIVPLSLAARVSR